MDTSWIEISREALTHNVSAIRSLIGTRTLLAPCVKANAYGHGLVGAARILVRNGADRLCVALIDEAVALRGANIRLPILIVGFVPYARLRDVLDTHSSIFVYETQTARALAKLAEKAHATVNIHIKVDTGMGRQGLPPHELNSFTNFIRTLKGLQLEGIATHFASSETPEHPEHFRKQHSVFTKLIQGIKKDRHGLPLIHCANSAATLLEPKSHFDMVRPGLAVYGYYPSETTKTICLKRGVRLKPALTLKTKVAAVKDLSKGACVSYNCTFITKRRTRIAVLPIGYYDGIDRRLSNRGEVLIQGKRAPILGRVCMNITVVDVTNIPHAKQEDEVVIIGKQEKDQITAEELAKRLGTINYEITTRLRDSLPRYYP